MKRWNTPEIETVEINKTENGCYCTEVEFCIWTNDSKKKEDPDTPDDPQTDTES